MGWIGKAATVLAVATACLAAGGSTVAQTTTGACRANCNSTYNACQRRAINSDTCLRRWLVCKRKCAGQTGMGAPPAPAPAPH